MFTKDWLSKWSIYSPDKIALEECETGRNLTYSQLNNCAIKMALLLEEQGIAKGDRVMVIAEHSLELVSLFGASQKMGFIIVPVNYRLTTFEIEYLINDCSPSIILYDEHLKEKISNDTCVKYNNRAIEGLLDPIDSITKRDYEPKYLSDDDPIFILYTSGTTGNPKGVIYTHKMLFWNSINTSISVSLTSEDHTINCMPSFHTGGWNVLLTPMLHRGATIGLVKKFNSEYILQLLEDNKSTIFMGVPTMLKMMMDSKAIDQVQLKNLRYFIVGGEALTHGVIKFWHNKGIKIRQGYGLTEVGPNLTSLHQDDAELKLGSIGKPNFYLDAKLMNESNQEVESGEIGEFWLKGDVVTPGYWKNELATQEAFDNGWFKTGDLMKQDSEGYLYVVDRKKSMYISGGENVYPAEVERVISKAPGVKEVAIIGVTDEKWGEVGKAFLVMEDGHIPNEIEPFCLDKLAKFKIPKQFVVIEELPKNDSGKIDRMSLKLL